MLYQSGMGLVVSETTYSRTCPVIQLAPMGKALLVKTGMVFKNIFEAIIRNDTATELSCKVLAPEKLSYSHFWRLLSSVGVGTGAAVCIWSIWLCYRLMSTLEQETVAYEVATCCPTMWYNSPHWWPWWGHIVSNEVGPSNPKYKTNGKSKKKMLYP